MRRHRKCYVSIGITLEEVARIAFKHDVWVCNWNKASFDYWYGLALYGEPAATRAVKAEIAALKHVRVAPRCPRYTLSNATPLKDKALWIKNEADLQKVLERRKS